MAFNTWMTHRTLSPDTGADGTNAETHQEGTPQTFDDLLKSNPEFQREFDRRMSKGIETREKALREQAEKERNAAVTEAQRVAQMNAAEKEQHEREKREEALKAREAAVQLREMRAQGQDMLAEKNLPLSLLPTLNLSTAEALKESVDAVEKAYRESVQAGIKAGMRGTPPPSGHGSGGDQMAEMRKAMGLK